MFTFISNVWKRWESHLPGYIVRVILGIYREYIQFKCIINDWNNRNRINRYNQYNLPLPPASLRWRVHASLDLDSFYAIGKHFSERIKVVLQDIDKPITSFQRVLDFGCGCGRTLMHFSNLSKDISFCGTDIDDEAINWCKQALPFAEFCNNSILPPLDFDSNSFDLVYAVSVFTHLNEEYQFHWLRELARVSKENAIIICTVHGESVWNTDYFKYRDKLQNKGFTSLETNLWKGIFPECYTMSYHSKRYVYEQYSKYFHILKYFPGGQDMIVMQKSVNIQVPE